MFHDCKNLTEMDMNMNIKPLISALLIALSSLAANATSTELVDLSGPSFSDISEASDDSHSSFDHTPTLPDQAQGLHGLERARLVANYHSHIAAISITPVPEPETFAMLLAGLGLVGAFARRRNARRFS
jgi:hypothetical protein